jgi:CubicO group peptidase (beta-lactamase class C family)
LKTNRTIVTSGLLIGVSAVIVALQAAAGTDDGDGEVSRATEAEALPTPPALPPADGPLDPVRLDSLLAAAEHLRPLSSLLVWHRGDLVVERYYGRMRSDRAVNLKSVSKTLLNPLVGIAIRDSLIDGVDTPLRRLLPDLYRRLDGSAADDPRKDEIRLRDLLDMGSGLETTSFRNYGAWVASPDWGWDQLRRPMECRPGDCYQYSTGVTHLLGMALAEAAGRDLRSYAQDVLFEPLDIPLPAWDRGPQGYYLGGNNMAMRPRDLLKIGVLYLDDGRHGDRQLVPEWWIRESWRPVYRSPWNGMGYGHLWWTSDWGGEQVHSAWGYGGQFLVVVPRLDLAVVATSSLARAERGHNRRMRRFFDRYVIPAFQSVPDAVGVSSEQIASPS